MKATTRRGFLRAAGGIAAGSYLPARAASPTYTVGCGRGTDPYSVTQRAIGFCASWPASRIAGANVVIKPNLVAPEPSSTGVTTDPQVVRAIVDAALAAGAATVCIAEQTGLVGGTPPWTTCGYSPLFDNYAPNVSLVDLATRTYRLVSFSGGLAYRQLWLPDILTDPATVVIMAAKMKTHAFAAVTLGCKVSFGFYNPGIYGVPSIPGSLPRGNQHELSTDCTVVDSCSVSQPVFTVIDGIVGLDNGGPIKGTPVNSNIVLAGANVIACDRAAMQFMVVPPNLVEHIALASSIGLGPSGMSSVSVLGDDFTPMPFILPHPIYPQMARPVSSPEALSQEQFLAGQTMTFSYHISQRAAVLARLDVILNDQVTPSNGPMVERTLFDWQTTAPGAHQVTFDGYGDSGTLLAPGEYQLRLSLRWPDSNTSTPLREGHSVAWIQVLA